MKLLSFICLLLMSVPAVMAQTTDDERAFIHGQWEANSSVVTNAMLSEVYFGDGLWSADLIEPAERRLSASNRLGSFQQLEIGANLKLNQTGLGHTITLFAGSASVLSGHFNKDSWNLFMHGNKMFEGDTAHLALGYHSLSYQTLGLTISKSIKESWELTYGIALYGLGNYSRVILDQSFLYTAPYGETITLRAAYSEQSISSGYHPGLGLHTGLRYTNDHIRFGLQLKDIGAVWAGASQQRQLDTLIVYEGQPIEDPTSPDLSAEGNSIYTMTEEFSLKSDTVRHFPGIPWRLQLFAKYMPDDQNTISGRMHYLHLPSYTPRLSLTYQRHFKTIALALINSYGGFGRYNFGIGIESVVKNKIRVAFETQYLNSLLFPRRSAGIGFNLRVALI